MLLGACRGAFHLLKFIGGEKMPSEKILSQKQEIVNELAEKMQSSVAGVLVDYKGITVEEDTQLRNKFREAGVEYRVVKNTLTRFAAEKIGFDFGDVLNGTTALAISSEDPVAPAKIVAEFAKTKESYVIKSGFLEGKVISVDEIKALSKIPSREGLIAQVLYGFNAPLTKFVYAINAIKEQLEKSETAEVTE